MFYTGLLKRIIPFLLTFAAGLFIASFFVTISFPRFRPSGRMAHRAANEFQQMKMENEQLREENFRLQAEIEARRGWSSSIDDTEYPPLPQVPAFDEDVPPPSAPRHR